MTGNRRIAVTSPQTRLATARRRNRPRWRAATLDPADVERAIALYRVQRRRAASAVLWLFTLVFGLPLLLAMLPQLGHLRLLGIPGSWLALVLVPFPAMALLARWHLRRAEKAEERG